MAKRWRGTEVYNEYVWELAELSQAEAAKDQRCPVTAFTVSQWHEEVHKYFH